MQIKPYILVPNLIEQPTWGGDYIINHKKINLTALASKKIGQSYELYQFSHLSRKTSTEKDPSLEMGHPSIPQQSKKIISNDEIFAIDELIKKNPLMILGKKAYSRYGPKIQTLIKFTQAKGNSFQIHVRKKTGKWLPKPESWYFFERGLITLGVKKNINWLEYQETCLKINQLAQKLSKLIINKEITYNRAVLQLNTYVVANNPLRFVNLIKTSKDQAVDLSACAIHHSWEEDKSFAPHGNIVYEVQENVFDPVSTIRSFDKGKIKKDGSIRELQVNDYFKFIDRSAWANNPKNHLIKPKIIKKSAGIEVKQIFKSKHYFLEEIKFNQSFQDHTKDSFHHLFVKKGKIVFVSPLAKLTITQGFSVFVPAATGDYYLNTNKNSEILKTYI